MLYASFHSKVVNDLSTSQQFSAENLKKKASKFINLEAFSIWCPLSDSNRPPTDYKSVALPDELKGQRIIF